MANDNYWDRVSAANQALRNARTVDQVIEICDQYFPEEKAAGGSGDAFYPGGADEGVLNALDSEHWTFLWIKADYYFCARDRNGDILIYTEGDIERDGTPSTETEHRTHDSDC